MCPSLVPPQPFLPSPGQDPQGWFVLVFSLVGGGWIIYAAGILLRGLARYLGMTALVLGLVLAIGGLIIHMIDYATYFAVYNWEVAARRITPGVCASQATYAAIGRQSQIAPLGHIGDGVMHACRLGYMHCTCDRLLRLPDAEPAGTGCCSRARQNLEEWARYP